MGLAVAVGASGKIATSPDGVTWTQRTSSFGTSTVNGVAYGNSLWVAVGVSGLLATSPDGITWTQQTSSFGSSPIYGVAYGGGQWVAAGGSGKIATSPDGITWTQRTSPFVSTLFAVAYSGGLWVAAGDAGHIATSPDGVAWTQRTNPFGTTTINGVGYGNGLWVAVGSGGALATSPDGVTWTARTSSFGTDIVNGVGYGNGLWVAVGTSGKVATSPDGVTWTQRTSFGTTTVNGVGYGSGLWVAVLNAGQMYTSTSGTAWTYRPSAFGTTVIQAVALIQNVAPNAPTITTPATGATIDAGATNRITVPFSDPDPGDSQSQLDLQWWDLDGTGARVGAAHTYSQTSPVQFWDSPPGTFTPGAKEMQAKSYDAQGLPSAWGPSAFFTAATAPSAPTITAPANGATVTNTATLTWSTPSQAAYQVQVLDGATVVKDTGEVTDSTARSLALSFPTNNTTRTIRVRRKVGGLWSEWAEVTVTVSWTAPPSPSGVRAPVPADAAIDLTITNPTPGAGEPTVSYNDVYYAEPGEAEERKATFVPPNSTWRHWLPTSDAVYTYRIVAVASNGTTSETVVS